MKEWGDFSNCVGGDKVELSLACQVAGLVGQLCVVGGISFAGGWGQAKNWDLGLTCASLGTAVSQVEGVLSEGLCG